MILTRRKLLSLVAAGAVIAPSLLAVQRTIFLPPRGGWPRMPIASYPVHGFALDGYYEWLKSGDFTYDQETGILSLWRHNPDRAQIDGKFHSSTGAAYDWEDIPDLPAEYASDEPLGADGRSKRALIDDNVFGLKDPNLRQKWWDSLTEEERRIHWQFENDREAQRARFEQNARNGEPNLSIPDADSRSRAAERAAKIRARLS